MMEQPVPHDAPVVGGGPRALDGPERGLAPDDTGLFFDRAVPPDGYAWWYVDALSDDGAHGLTVIFFIGSVFSPYYAWRARRDPLDHVAVNVALYGRGGARWAMTERGRGDLSRERDTLRIGPSALVRRGDAVEIVLAERGCPVPHEVKGRVVVTPECRGSAPFLLAPDGHHCWWPIAPRAHVEVELDAPRLSWRGTGYLDSNWGAGALERAFSSWTWARAPLRDGACVLYDVERRDGATESMALRFARDGATTRISPPPVRALPDGLWGIPRHARSEGAADVVETLTDAHFYVRSAVRTTLCGEETVGVHESLSLDRFARPWVKALLPFRMPRRARR